MGHGRESLAIDWRSIGDLLALDLYDAAMKPNPVIHHTFIVRNQIEYSVASQAVILRSVLEIPSTGQHQGFTEIEALLAALGAELRKMQSQIIPSGKREGEISENPS